MTSANPNCNIFSALHDAITEKDKKTTKVRQMPKLWTLNTLQAAFFER